MPEFFRGGIPWQKTATLYPQIDYVFLKKNATLIYLNFIFEDFIERLTVVKKSLKIIITQNS